jgi:hypothetical protein
MAAAGPSSIHHRVACRLATRAKPSASLELGTQGHVGRSDDLRRWPTAAPTATPADRGGRRRAEAAEASRSQTPTNGAELRKGFEDRGDRPARPETGLVVRPFPQTEEVTAGRAASGGLPTRQVVAEDEPRPSREPVADATPRSHFVGWGVLASSAGSGAPDPSSTEARPRTAGRAVRCWLLGLQRPHVGGLGTLGPDVTSNSTAWPSSSER